MSWSRRLILTAAAALAGGAAAGPARAAVAHYPLACDPALVTALRAASAAFLERTGIFVHILPTSPSLLVGQMTHQIQNDIIVARADIAGAVAAAGYPSPPGAPAPRFQSRVVLATRIDAPADAVKTGPFAITDPQPGAARDDVAVLAAMGIHAAHTLGAIDSGGVAFLVASGAAMAGVMLMSDVRAIPGLKVAIAAPGDVPPPVYLAALTRTPARPQPQAFLAFLASAEGAAILSGLGVETRA